MPATLPKDQKERVTSALSLPYGRVELIADGFAVLFQVHEVKALHYRVMVYVNGVFHGKWLLNDHPESKFYREVQHPVWTPAEKSRLVKQFGKRLAEKEFGISKTFIARRTDFASGKAALSHLLKVCDAVSVVKTSVDGLPEHADASLF